MLPIRQGDVILLPVKQVQGTKLSHLTLAEGEVTGHSHRISNGQAELYERDGVLYLKISSPTATLNHEEHHALEIPQGNWMIRIQREYVPQRSGSASRLSTPYRQTQPEASVSRSDPRSVRPAAPSPASKSNLNGLEKTTDPILTKWKQADPEMQELMQQLNSASDKELMASVWHGVSESKRLQASVQQSPQNRKGKQLDVEDENKDNRSKKKLNFAYDWQKPTSWKSSGSELSVTSQSSVQPLTSKPIVRPEPSKPVLQPQPAVKQFSRSEPQPQRNWRTVID
jgi:hypothetical protein